jgi:type II secretory pathway pseudopilin PulG
MLVPALVGYIDRAKAEKEYQTAATVYGAAQAVITEKYAKNEFTDTEKSAKKIVKGAELKSMGTGKDAVLVLAGVDTKAVTGYEFAFTDNIISGGHVIISGYKYTLTISETDGSPSWSAAKDTSTQQGT